MSKSCFIVSPIGKEDSDIRKLSDEKYDLVFKPVLEELGYESSRADKDAAPNSLSEKIVESIICSDLVIVDIEGDNTNVFYELAIRNAVNKPVIIVKGKDQNPPFDIYDKRAISLDMNDNRQWNDAKKELKNYIISAENNPTDASKSILSNFMNQIELNKKREDELGTKKELQILSKKFDEFVNPVQSISEKNNIRSNVSDKESKTEYDDVNKYFKEGNSLFSLGKYEEAIVCYGKVIEIDPDNAYAYNNKGTSLGKLGKDEEAIKCYGKAIEIDPDYAKACNNKAVSLLKLGRKEEAKNSYNKAIEINPNLKNIDFENELK